jgi:3-oxoacyl-[acyl-carrier protein] reductase
MNLQLTNQVAFIAGSSRGIGRSIAATLLAEGANIVLTGRDEKSLERTLADLATQSTHARILPIAGDFTDPIAIQKAYDRTLCHWGRFDQNFFASVRLTEAALPHLKINGGSILYISSITAVEATPAPLPYSAAKAALTNYAKNLSRHLAPDNIRVNTICPGNIFFPGGSWERHIARDHEKVAAMLKTEVPQNRFGTPEEIASLAGYLCSPHAAFSTGSTYIMDGGQTRTI